MGYADLLTMEGKFDEAGVLLQESLDILCLRLIGILRYTNTPQVQFPQLSSRFPMILFGRHGVIFGSEGDILRNASQSVMIILSQRKGRLGLVG